MYLLFYVYTISFLGPVVIGLGIGCPDVNASVAAGQFNGIDASVDYSLVRDLKEQTQLWVELVGLLGQHVEEISVKRAEGSQQTSCRRW